MGIGFALPFLSGLAQGGGEFMGRERAADLQLRNAQKLEQMRLDAATQSGTIDPGEAHRVLSLIDPGLADQFQTQFMPQDGITAQRIRNPIFEQIVTAGIAERKRAEQAAAGRQLQMALEEGAAGTPRQPIGLGTEMESGGIYDLAKPEQPGNPTLKAIAPLLGPAMRLGAPGEKVAELVMKVLQGRQARSMQHLKYETPEGQFVMPVDPETGLPVQGATPHRLGDPTQGKSVFQRRDIEDELALKDQIDQTSPADPQYPQLKAAYEHKRAYNNAARLIPVPQGGSIAGAGNILAGENAPVLERPLAPGQQAEYVNRRTLEPPPAGMLPSQIQASGEYIPVSPGQIANVKQFKTVSNLVAEMRDIITTRSNDYFPHSTGSGAKDAVNVTRAWAKWQAAEAIGNDPDLQRVQTLLAAIPTMVKAFGDTGNISQTERTMTAQAAGLSRPLTYEAAMAKMDLLERFVNSSFSAYGLLNPGGTTAPRQDQGTAAPMGGRAATAQEWSTAMKRSGGDAQRALQMLREMGIDTTLQIR